MIVYIIIAVLILLVLLIIREIMLRVTSKEVGTSLAEVKKVITNSC